MKPQAKNKEEILSETLNLFSKVSPEEAESAEALTLTYLQLHAGEVAQARVWDADSVRPVQRWRWLAVATIAAAIAIAIVVPVKMAQRAPAVLEDVAGSRKIPFGEVLRSSGGPGETLVLADGSRVEMRAKSELSLERADDGVRIQLHSGGIIVNAAKQRNGHLYVQTKDVMVSVVGTVFLVNAEEEGSRVAVIEGEVHVQQGVTETKLRPGEQVTSNPRMESIPVKDEVAWSREAVAHVALLQQVPASRTGETPKEEKLNFEEASIRATAPVVSGNPGGRGGGGGALGAGSANRRPGEWGCVAESSNLQRIDPRRLFVPTATLAQLIAHSYPAQDIPGFPMPTPGQRTYGPASGLKCGLLGKMGILSGGADWIRTAKWDLEALIPEGVFTSTPNIVTDPKLQQMIRTLLVNRFKLVIRRETREVPVYLLKVGKDGPKLLKMHAEGTAVATGFGGGGGAGVGGDTPTTQVPGAAGGRGGGAPPPAANPNGSMGFLPSIQGVRGFFGQNASMELLARTLFEGPGSVSRLVFDRTGLTGRYDFQIDADSPIDRNGGPDALDRAYANVLRDTLKALGLELEESRIPVEAWVIERAEKPTEN